MLKLTILTLVTVLVGVGVTVHWCYLNDIRERFPDLDRKVARKAFYRMMKNSYSGKYPDIQSYDDNQMDELFLAEVTALQSA